jgi:hypothetical protein
MFIVTQDGARALAEFMDAASKRIKQFISRYIYNLYPVQEPKTVTPYRLKGASNSDAFFVTVQDNESLIPDFSDYQPKPYRWK